MPTAKTKPAPARRNIQYEKRLASILKAAAKVIARDGFEGASVRKVASAAGINLSGIYYYFKSKEELLFALQKHTFSTLVQALDKKLKNIDAPEQKLKAVIDNHFQFFAANLNDLKVCVHEIDYNEILKIRQKYFRLVRGVVAENMRSAGRYHINLSALFLFGSMNWIYMWYDPKKNAGIDGLSKQLLKMQLHGISTS